MSYILRHAPADFGLASDEQGWVEIKSLISAIRSQRGYSAVTQADLITAVNSGAKRRHEIRDERIRALYGHSLDRKIEHLPAEPPAELFHGTISRFLPQIVEQGLSPMSRQYVHLSADPKTAWAVANRHGDDVVILRIRASTASSSGVVFYNPWDIIWLADEVPSRFIELA